MLELKNVSYSVEEQGSKKEILDHVSFTIEESFVAITGPNGGGKSTTARLIMGIIQPTDGQIYYDGTDITKMTITERANLGLSFAFQQPVRFKGLTVADIVRLAAGKKLTTDEICDYLSEVGLCARDYMNRELNASLSGGELKRIEIAMVLARNTKLALFDEPEAGIDLWSFNNLIQVFQNMQKKNHGSIITISHQERILNIAERIIVISDGKVAADGKRTDILPKLLDGSIYYGHEHDGLSCGKMHAKKEAEQ